MCRLVRRSQFISHQRVSRKQPSEVRTVWTTVSISRRQTQPFRSRKHKRPQPGPLLFHGERNERTTSPFRAEFCRPVFQKILQRRATLNRPENNNEHLGTCCCATCSQLLARYLCRELPGTETARRLTTGTHGAVHQSLDTFTALRCATGRPDFTTW